MLGRKRRKISVSLISVLMCVLLFSPSPVLAQPGEVTGAQMLDMCYRTHNFINESGVLPNIIYIDGSRTESVTAAEFYYMMARWLRFYDDNNCSPNTVEIVRNISGPSSPNGVKDGILYKDEMFIKSKSNANFIDANKYVPNYTMLANGSKITPEAFFWCMARTINFYRENGVMPNYTAVRNVDMPDSWDGGSSNHYPWSKTLYVPYTAQPDSYTCGPTSLSMMMEYYGVNYPVSTISSYMASIGDSPYYDGVAPGTIVSAAKHYGFSNVSQKYGWNELKSCIAANKPCIAHLQIYAGGNPRYYPSSSPVYSSFTGGHYVVVCGLQSDNDGNVLYVVVNDPSKGAKLKYTAASFDSSWAVKNRRLIGLK